MKKETYNKFLFIVIIILGIAAILVWGNIKAYQDNRLYAYFLDVGQGDSIYLRTPNNHDVLIDGGPDNNVLSKLGGIMPFYDRRIELMVLTHPHEDHINGLIEVLNKYQVENVLAPAVIHDSVSFIEWERGLKLYDINVVYALQGQKVDFGSSMMEILSPNQEMLEDENINNASIAVKYTYGETELMLTGDAETEAEEYMIETYGKNLQTDLLKVGHHGSKTSSTEPFLDLVEPKYAIISVGVGNKFKHPSGETIKKLEEKNIKYYRTDYHGTISCISDARELKCSKEKF